MTPFIFLIVTLFFLVVLVRRMFKVEKQTLDVYLRSHEEKAEHIITAMHAETSRFDAGEALAPVEAGIRELLELHGASERVVLDRHGDTLVLEADQSHVEVFWKLCATSVTRKGHTRYFYGNGQWELSINHAFSEPYPRLDTLMGRLSQILREMSNGTMPGKQRTDVSCGPLSHALNKHGSAGHFGQHG